MYETHDKRALLLPNVTSADAGKVLAVDENGKLSLEEMGSGGGLTLYGPYYAESSSSKTIEAGHTLDISLNDVTNYDRDTLSAPSGRYTAFLIGVYGLNTGFTNPKLLNFNAPYYESQYMSSAQVSVANDGNTDITLYPNSYGVMFYSDAEFTPVSQGE